jgi:hypothetical protein
LVLCTFLAGCGLVENPIAEFLSALTFGIPFQTIFGAMPRPASGGGGLTVTPSGGGGQQVRPGSRLDVQLDWSGGQADYVNLGFGGDRYFRFELPSSQSSGTFNIPIQVSSGLDLERAAEIPCVYQVGADAGGGTSGQSRTEIVACAGCGVCTPGESCQRDTGGGGGIGFSCNSSAYCRGKTLRTCSNGTSCYYEVSGRRYNCSGCNCQSAAQTVVANEC